MKIKRLLTTIVAGVMSVSLLGSVVSAQYGMGDLSLYEGMYTFSELLDMSKEEFLGLGETAEESYYDIEMTPKAAAETYYSNQQMFNPSIPDYEVLKVMYGNLTGLVGTFYCTVDANDMEYFPYETEKCIKYLLGSYVDYEIKSPLYSGASYYPDWQFAISIDNYSLNISEITDEDILYLAKFEFCIRQAHSKLYALPFYNDILSPALINYGEANGDGKLTAADAAFIARKLAEQKADELPATADFNRDGNVTALDCAKIAQFLAAKSMAQAEGMIEQQ